jgi:hypothetical protein
MTDRQFNRVRSFNATLEVNNLNLNVIKIIPAFVVRNEKLQVFLRQINEVSGAQSNYNKGITKEKNRAKMALADAMYLISAKMKAYAFDKQDDRLMGQFKTPRSSFEKMADGALIPYCRFLAEIIYPLLDLLPGYGLGLDNMAHLETLMDDYSAKQAAPRLTIVERSQLTKKLELLINDCSQMLRNEMDPLAEEFKTTNPDFYLQYKGTREIIDLGKTYTKMRGFVTEGNTAGPALKGVKIKVEGSELEAMSAANGHYSLVRVQPGTRNIEVSKKGYKTLMLDDIYFKPGAEINKKLVLEKEEMGIKLNTEAVENAFAKQESSPEKQLQND